MRKYVGAGGRINKQTPSQTTPPYTSCQWSGEIYLAMPSTSGILLLPSLHINSNMESVTHFWNFIRINFTQGPFPKKAPRAMPGLPCLGEDPAWCSQRVFLAIFQVKDSKDWHFQTLFIASLLLGTEPLFNSRKWKRNLTIYHVGEGRKSAIVGTEEPSVPAVSTNSQLWGKQTLCSCLLPPTCIPQVKELWPHSQTLQLVTFSWAGCVAEARRACGPQASLRLFQGAVSVMHSAHCLLGDISHSSHKHTGVRGKELPVQANSI